MKHSPRILHPKCDGDFLSRHHAYPKGRLKHDTSLKTDYPELTIRLWRSKHDAFHALFGFRTIDEIIHLLKFENSVYNSKWYKKVFKCSRFKAMLILIRIKRIKTRNYEPTDR